MSHDVFKDLGFNEGDAENLKFRAMIMSAMADYIRSERLTQDEAADLLNVSQPRVSDLVNGRIEKFSLDKLVTMITRLGMSLELRIDRHAA